MPIAYASTLANVTFRNPDAIVNLKIDRYYIAWALDFSIKHWHLYVLQTPHAVVVTAQEV
jgi:hypothetical protein